MSRREKTWVVSALWCALVLPPAAGQAVIGLRLEAGSFQRKLALERALARVSQGNPTAAQRGKSAATLTQQMEAIDKQYSMFISAVADSAYHGNSTEVTTLCEGAGRDPIGLLVCHLATYIVGSRGGQERFVEEFPTSGIDLQALWMLDRIPDGEEGRPILFEPDGPTDLCISELYRIVQKGNPQALSVYMRLYRAAGGEYSEFMQDQLEGLFQAHVQVVLRNWTELKKWPLALSNLAEDITHEEKERILANAHQYCGTYQAACKDMYDLFSH